MMINCLIFFLVIVACNACKIRKCFITYNALYIFFFNYQLLNNFNLKIIKKLCLKFFIESIFQIIPLITTFISIRSYKKCIALYLTNFFKYTKSWTLKNMMLIKYNELFWKAIFRNVYDFKLQIFRNILYYF